MKRAALRAALAVFLCLAAFPAFPDQAPYPKDEAALRQELREMNWLIGPDGFQVEASHSTVKPPAGFSTLLGKDAQRYEYLINGIEFPQTEFVVYDPDRQVEVAIEFRPEGFVKDDDWSDIDPDDFLRQLIEGQKEANKERAANGQEPFDVIGWIEKPTYDKATHVAHYVLELGDAQQHWPNAVAVKLGREGYHKFIWVGDMEQYKMDGPQVLASVLDGHSYDAGYRYIDVKEGDKVAAYGIAGLVAAVAGVKLGKGLLAGAFAFLAIAGKKLAILVIPLAAGVWAGVKRFFRRS
ncbi:DUF2167 domain-containing protein [Dongia rigui]|uniref:DUF2167 domain-containing protein n=1 Tax=Dongia rigui TaxID=940149 RepID=A0ABU5E068_9PROT|nr:DUF2167 domain-containing protein [Dongia rigui]MDY0872935.1 DUF2167 domain-containing protein [Dongia rigui]